MIPYRDKKIINAVAFFAKQHRKKAKRPLYQTFLYKYLAFLDFYSLKETGRPALGLTYKAMKHGPVPMEIYGDKQDTPKYKFQEDEWGEFIVVIGKPDLNYFSPYEIELMERFIDFFAQVWVNTTVISDSSHEEILAWSRTWNEKPNKIIEYALEFEGDLFSKNEEDLTFPEEVFLTLRAMAF